MSKRFYTFIVVPSDSSLKSRHFRISSRLFKVARNTLILLVLALALMVMDYGTARHKAGELNRFKKENTRQKIELQSLSSKMDTLETQLAKLNLFDRKLRIIANIEVPNQGEAAMGMGGPVSDEYLASSLASTRDRLVERMQMDLARMETEVDRREQSFTELQESLLNQSSLLASTPSVWPTRGWVTSTFGMRKDPFTGRRQMHRGLDIANRHKSPVVSPAEGIVTKVTRLASMGKLIVLSHGYGIQTRYSHLSKIYKKVGDRVKRGDKIAAVGSTGRSTGPHLHYEVIVNGVMVNPKKYILN